MLLGVHVSAARVSAVWLAEPGSIGELSEQVAGAPLADALDALVRALARMAAARGFRSSIRGLVFDVSDVLSPDTRTPITLVRIAPRPPIDADHEIRVGEHVAASSVVSHVAGGHTALGEELAPLDESALARLADSSLPERRFVVTSVGALVNPEHEVRAGTILGAHPTTIGVELSRTFFSSSFAVRERTAAVNSALLADATGLGTMLGLICGEHFPGVRVYVTTNDGGRVPLARLTTTPVHSLFSGRPAELVGAAHLSGVSNGEIVIAADTPRFAGELLNGVPAVVPQTPSDPFGVLASQTANTYRVGPDQLSRRLVPAHLVHTAARNGDPAAAGISGTTGAATVVVGTTVARPRMMSAQALENQSKAGDTLATVDLRALGAATAPLSDWTNRILSVASADDMAAGLAAAEARAHARLVAAGARSSEVRIVESVVAASAYETPNIVSLRVRGIADLPRAQPSEGSSAVSGPAVEESS